MPQYHHLGNIPHKRHTQFRKPNGELYAEELVSTHGFSNVYSLIYHCYPPTLIKEVGEPVSAAPKIKHERFLKHQSFEGFDIRPEDDFLKSRKPVLVNGDVHISLAAPRTSMKDHFYKNADADEVIFVHEGTGKLKTLYGTLTFAYGDYLVIPRGIIYQISFDSDKNRLLIIESFSAIETPRRYRNPYGQHEEHSPFYERDFRKPADLE